METRTETRHEVLLPQTGYFGIELPLDCGEVDLHNFADYCGCEVNGATVRLRWRESILGALFIRASSGKKWTKNVIRELVWVFEGAVVAERRNRDCEMPLSEDQTLAEYRVLANDPSGFRIEFSFHGGVVFEISAERQYAIVS